MVQEQIDYAIIGLGNPGKTYQMSRHNIGFLVADFLASQYTVSHDQIECFSITKLALYTLEKKLLIVKPATFMNNSGKAVLQIIQKYHFTPHQLLILHDDLDLPINQLRFKSRGQSGGHRGIESIISTLHTDNFTRLKIGIGRPDITSDPVDYVLSAFSNHEWKEFQAQLHTIKEAIELWINQGFHVAANRYNRKNSSEHE